MREYEHLPDWLVEGLIPKDDKPPKKEQKQEGPAQLWRRVNTGGSTIIVRSANKRIGTPIRSSK